MRNGSPPRRMPGWTALVLLGTVAACTDPLVTAPPPGHPAADAPGAVLPYRAVGTEPFWSVTLEDGRMVYEDTEQRRIVVDNPRHRTTFNGHRYESQRLTLDVSRAQCSDGMSDTIYPDTVLVIADGRELRGCGGSAAPPNGLEDSHWRITSINGDDVSGAENYTLSFDDGRVSGRAGCNSLSGGFRTERDRLITGPIAATRMACPGPRMDHEQFVLNLLRGPVQITYFDPDTLILSGPSGFIRLSRLI